ncbi:phosphatase PAP2 family protein [Rhodococcus sp. X156]|uniref:phosphatase PAP2 family protein n=1 Tax=Rhodococcus sp. X156 TaxID=2499145 RepID=UPI000FDC3C2C|nr:phosphatase PAP2 family protein [Rhodococcus sp. X156]
MLLADPTTTTRAWLRSHLRVLLGVLAGLVLLGLVEALCASQQLTGPTLALLSVYVTEQPSAPGIYCGLLIALVLAPRRLWWPTLGAALAVDAVLSLARLVVNGEVRSVGAGALVALTGLAVHATTRLHGAERLAALRGLGCGAALVAATALGNVWLELTAALRPEVLDEYLAVADHALLSPAWLVGRLFDHLGVVGHYFFLTVYSMLPLMAVFAAGVQLWRGWQRHNIMLTFVAVGLLGPALYLLFPVVGPMFAFGADGGEFAYSTQWPDVVPVVAAPEPLLFNDFTPRNCMPSLHTAWAVVIFVHTRPMGRAMRAVGTFWLVGTLAATLGFGYHYGVDLVVGAVFALTIEAALRSRVHGWSAGRVWLVAGGSAVVALLLLSFRYAASLYADRPAVLGVLVLAALGLVCVGYGRLHGRQIATPRTGQAAGGTAPSS